MTTEEAIRQLNKLGIYQEDYSEPMKAIALAIKALKVYREEEDDMVHKYIKKPVEITAIQFTGYNAAECEDFIVGGKCYHPPVEENKAYLIIKTLEGDMRCDKDDYIIKGVKGEFYPCKPDIFEQTYELVRD